MRKEEVRTIQVKRIITDKNGNKRVKRRDIPEAYPGEYREEEGILAEIFMDMFFAPK